MYFYNVNLLSICSGNIKVFWFFYGMILSYCNRDLTILISPKECLWYIVFCISCYVLFTEPKTLLFSIQLDNIR